MTTILTHGALKLIVDENNILDTHEFHLNKPSALIENIKPRANVAPFELMLEDNKSTILDYSIGLYYQDELIDEITEGIKIDEKNVLQFVDLDSRKYYNITIYVTYQVGERIFEDELLVRQSFSSDIYDNIPMVQFKDILIEKGTISFDLEIDKSTTDKDYKRVLVTLLESNVPQDMFEDNSGIKESYQLSFNHLKQNTIYHIQVNAFYGDTKGGCISNYAFITPDWTNKVYTVDDFLNAKDYPNNILMNDIDLSGVEINPVILDSRENTFDGNGFTLKNLNISSENLSELGLFSINKGTIKDLNVENFTLNINEITNQNEMSIGGLVGHNEGLIDNVNIKGNMNIILNHTPEKLYLGGLVGYNDGVIHSSRDIEKGIIRDSKIDINTQYSSTSNMPNDLKIGGIIGHNELGKINSCHASNYLQANYNNSTETIQSLSIGGIIGYSKDGEISNTSSNQIINVDGQMDNTALSIGGLIGESRNTNIKTSVSEGDINASSSLQGYIGGLIGKHNGIIINSFSLTNINATSEDILMVGGLVGVNRGSIENTYSANQITTKTFAPNSNFHYVGGLVGKNIGNINNSFTLTNINANSLHNTIEFEVYHFVGINNGTLNHSYYTTQQQIIKDNDTLERQMINGLSIINQLNTDFYINTLSLDTDIWNISVNPPEFKQSD